MNWCRAALLSLPIAIFATNAMAQDAKPPFADGPTEKAKPKPKSRTWTVTAEGFSMSYLFEPGIPDPGQVTEIMIVASSVPARPHPRYGSRVPLNKARIFVEVTNPAGESLGRYVAHALPLTSGKYGLHFTPGTEGIYTLRITGKTADGKDIKSSVKLPVAVWPLPDELKGSGDGEGARTARRVIRKPLGK